MPMQTMTFSLATQAIRVNTVLHCTYEGIPTAAKGPGLFVATMRRQ